MSAEAVAVRDAPSAVVRPRRAPSFWRSATNSALTVVLLAVLALAIALAVVPRLMGGAALTVLTGSMEPTYSPGDMVVSVPQDRYEIGDVVTYQPVSDDPTLITHRVVAVRELPGGVEYITRGDANGADDDPIVDGQVMGEAIYDVPYIGHLAAAVGENRSGLLAFAGIALLSCGIYATGSAVITRRRTRQSSHTASTPPIQGE